MSAAGKKSPAIESEVASDVEAFHLFRYLDEQAYRFNERSKDDAGRFIGAMNGICVK
jgi:hypothetical protein